MKQHIRIYLHNEGNPILINTITQIIGANNGGKALFSIYDVIATIKLKKVEYPATLQYIKYEIIGNKIFLSEIRNQEPIYFCTLEWIEIQELNCNVSSSDSVFLSESEKDSLFKIIENELKVIDNLQQEEALKECKNILNSKPDNDNLEERKDEE